MSNKRYPNRKCYRCKEQFGVGDRCAECGMKRMKKVKRLIKGVWKEVEIEHIARTRRRKRPIGGKRGRNSGKVGSAKSKK